jgi:hypothetical protein
VQLVGSSFRTIQFDECKLMGLRLEQCQEFGTALVFNRCNLNHSSFYKIKAKNAQFNHCSMVEVDFTSADLTGANFETCDLSNAQFDQTNLEKSDFRTALHSNPEYVLGLVMKVKKAIKSCVLERFYDVVITELFQRIKSRRRLSLKHFLFAIEF